MKLHDHLNNLDSAPNVTRVFKSMTTWEDKAARTKYVININEITIVKSTSS